MPKIVAFIVVLTVVLMDSLAFAQTLGSAPAFNRAVQGQTGAQSEGPSSTSSTGLGMSWRLSGPVAPCSARLWPTCPAGASPAG